MTVETLQEVIENLEPQIKNGETPYRLSDLLDCNKEITTPHLQTKD